VISVTKTVLAHYLNNEKLWDVTLLLQAWFCVIGDSSAPCQGNKKNISVP